MEQKYQKGSVFIYEMYLGTCVQKIHVSASTCEEAEEKLKEFIKENYPSELRLKGLWPVEKALLVL